MITPVDVPADAEYAYYDMGLCGPLKPSPSDVNARPDFSATTTLCGVFKVPTLRNVAITSPYFHNGVFSDLHQVVEWYVTRDINNDTGGNNPNPVAAGPGGNPYAAVGTFYTAADGTPDLYEYNDLPVDYDANVNVGEIPYTPPTFGGGQAPTLDARGDRSRWSRFSARSPTATTRRTRAPTTCPRNVNPRRAAAAAHSRGTAP